MTVTIYGIKNCDTMKKARNWLDDQGIAYNFHDYKKDGLITGIGANIFKLLAAIEWEKLLNRAGTTFRKLDDATKANVNEAKARELMLEQPSMVKRPVLEKDDQFIVGFKPELYEEFFS